MLTGRSLIVGAMALALAFFIVRDAMVAAYASSQPGRAAAVWGGHPDVLVSKALTEIGAAAAKRLPPPERALAAINKAASLSPLSPEPFLVRGILAQQAGDARLAERAFVAARQRAPREAAPRYFLAELYIGTGRETDGLRELATLARLLPDGPRSVAPSLAAYAKTTGDMRALKATFRQYPELADSVLGELAKDPANVTVATRLADRLQSADGSAVDWVKLMLQNLVAAGQYQQARNLWELASREQAEDRLFNSSFGASQAPPPFNWTYRSDSTGIAERDGHGGLHVVFYGREDSVLASQTLLLSPGRYRLINTVAGNPAGLLGWSMTCLPTKTPLLSLSLGAAAGARPVAEFAVGADCPAQILELKGVSGEDSKEADVTISGLALIRGADAR